MSHNNSNRRQTLGPLHFNASSAGGGLSQPDASSGFGGGKPARLPAGPGGAGAPRGGGRYSMAPWASTGFGGGDELSAGGSQQQQPLSQPSALLDAAGGARRSSVYVHPSAGMGGHKGGSGTGAAGGASAAGSSLALSGSGVGALRADPRPVASREFQDNCIRTLIAFLCARGYPHPLSPKLLRSPTAKDFSLVAQFLAARFDPCYAKAFGRAEDEVPTLLKRLGYPFQVPKSALFAVGSPHSWPSVLAALAWLVELLTYEERADAAAQEQERRDNGGVGGVGGGVGGVSGAGAGGSLQPHHSGPMSARRPGLQMAADDVTMMDASAAAAAAAAAAGEADDGDDDDEDDDDDDEDGGNNNNNNPQKNKNNNKDAFDAAEGRARGERRFYRYVSSAYRHFLSGDDAAVAAADGAMSAAFARRRANAEAAARRAADAAAELAAQASRLRSEPSPLEAAAARRDACAADRAKLEAALEQQKQAKAALERKNDERAADALARKSQSDELEREIARLKAVVQAQSLSRADVGRLLAERAAAKEALEAACAQRESVEARCAEGESALELRCAALEEALRPYHAAARRLALAPMAAKRAGGLRFEVGDGGGGGGGGNNDGGNANANANAAHPPPPSSGGIVDRHADDVVGMLRGVDPKGAVRPALARLRDNYRARARELAQDALALGEALGAAEEAATERGEEAAAAEAALRRLEAAHRELKGALDADVAAAGGQADRIAQEAAAVRARVARGVAEAEARAERAAQELERARERCGDEAAALSAQLNAALGAALSHRLDVKAALEQAQAAVGAAVGAVKEARAPLPAAG